MGGLLERTAGGDGMTTTTSPLAAYAGRVLSWREDNGYDDSDFYALVQEGDGFRWIMYASTRYHPGGYAATVDATPEVCAAYTAWYAEMSARAEAAEEIRRQSEVSVGREVRIINGRKHKGKSGTVTWYGKCRYTSSRRIIAYRVLVETPEGDSFFCPADYCAVETSDGWKPCTNARRYHSSLRMGAAPESYLLSQYPDPSRLR